MFRLTPAVRSLVLANVAIWVLQQFGAGAMDRWFALWPWGSEDFEPWQLLSYAFLHDPSDPLHLIFNMIVLASLGSAVEQVWGRSRFLTYYVVCVLSAALCQLAVTSWMHSGEPTLGASGGVYGVLLAFVMLFPRRIIVLLFPPIPMPAWLLIPLILLGELVFGLTGAAPGIAHFAHLGGAFGGWLMILAGRRMRGQRGGYDDGEG